ncbi:MAG: 6-phosphogluconolactonase [Kiritimatiellae bacterium]|nr:6-phosphogluconolactonase [Kiritimatiellia bacterium]
MQIRIFSDSQTLAEALAQRLREAFREGPDTAVMLAGGRTPLAAYSKLAEDGGLGPDPAIAFLSDERVVPTDSPESNQGAILPRLRAAGLPPERFIPVLTDRSADEAAARFSADLDSLRTRGTTIRLGLLGLGADGHTASLFSLEDVARATGSGRWAVAVRRASPPDRVSTTPPFFQLIAELLFVVTGADKAQIVSRLVRSPEQLPAGAATAGHPSVGLWLDRAAASGI